MPRVSQVSPAIRACAVVLCLLAASPLTAPFSTLDLADLYDSDAQRPAAALQIKSTKDHSVCDAGSAPSAPVFVHGIGRAPADSAPAPAAHRRIHSILRL